MRILLKAYEVLSNPEKRAAYDRNMFLRISRKKESFNYREYLRNRENDFTSQAKLILYDLLHSYHEEALFLYKKLSAQPHFHLYHFLNREDYMDCTFLLAEQFLENGEYLLAFDLFKTVYTEELRNPYYKHFIYEIIERLKRIACFQLIGRVSPDRSIQYMKELLDFDFPNKDKALLYKKIAETYAYLGNQQMAVEFLDKGLQYNRKLTGIKKLKEKIKNPEIHVAK